jgi:hypothetical protein
MDRAALERMLESYGGATERWPDQPDAAARDLLASDPALRQAWREAIVMDQMLSAPSAPDAEAQRALADRIVAAAVRSPRLATVEGTGEGPRQAASPQPVAGPRLLAKISDRLPRKDLRRGLAVLAASLVVGLSLGQMGLVDRTLAGVEEITGVSLTAASLDLAGAIGSAEAGEEL